MRQLKKHGFGKIPAMLLLLLFSVFFKQAQAKAAPFSAIEVVLPAGKAPDINTALHLCKKYKLPLSSVYTWKNHLVIYGRLRRFNLLRHELTATYPQAMVKTYQNPFYDFDRAKRCKTGVVKNWDNILLTADLVPDAKMQREYLNYHATQFKKWPEVSRGFCNAQFQQLLVFKNGRQLLLVISIPKGENLDKLNPLTSRNNPRVDEWNKLMSKYQEGIPGTKKGETWVFLTPAGR